MEVRNNKKNTLYLVLGVLTLIIATAGATFAYFTATDTNTGTITGDMAVIEFDVKVDKMTFEDDVLITRDDETDGKNAEENPTARGIIPMSNSMVEYAVNNKGKDSAGNATGICMDDNGNPVCQIYKITVNNTGTASMLLDGYVTLENGSGNPTDYPEGYYTTVEGKKVVNTSVVKNTTTMRWAQAFCSSETTKTINGESKTVVSNCTTAGTTTTTATKSANGGSVGITANWATVLNTATDANAGYNANQILTSGITTKAMISGSEYNVIDKNFIRLSNHQNGATYDQTSDVTSALVYNEFLTANDNQPTNNGGTSSSTYTDSQVFYIVVWLSETGTNQTAHAGVDGATNAEQGFFKGTVKFVSAQGSEVTSTFTGYTSVRPDTVSP